MLKKQSSSMNKTIHIFIVSLVLASCSGPSYFKSPTDFIGGNRAAAVETHCARRAGAGKDSNIYRLCEQSFNTHYGQ